MSGPPSLVEDGLAILVDVLSPEEADALAARLPESAAGMRNLLQRVPEVRSLAWSERLRLLLCEHGQHDMRPVRALFFDKNPSRNWGVPWHQDLMIAVKRRLEAPGFGPWSVKDGVPHVRPPRDFLERMVTLRIHLDTCGTSNGPLRVIRSSHLHGPLQAHAIDEWKKGPTFTCVVHKGAAVLMKPLLLHSSSPATTPGHRRVIHIEYSPDALPGGLEWYEDPPA